MSREKVVITVEETRTKEVEVEAGDYYEAFEMVEELYKNGAIDMHAGSWVTASLGDEKHDFSEIAQWGC
ncbi:MAG: hypothetical protein IJ111_01305 [Eggerthellaceae bacterium]|nr:hypothetical protein [Eggerthellaceae bacterium]